MPSYRAYLLDRGDHVVGVQLLSCLADDAAISAASPFLDLHDIEVWAGTRMVARLKREGTWTDATFGSLLDRRSKLGELRGPAKRRSRTAEPPADNESRSSAPRA